MGRELAVGIALTTDPERARDKFARFCACLERATGLAVRAHGMLHYHHLATLLEEGDLDIVWLPPMLALRATGRGSVTPIALPVRHGVSTYATALFTRPESPIHKLADLDGARAAWVDPHSASGYLVIRALLRSKGVHLERAFGKHTFLGAHDAVVKMVLAGEADVGATFAYLDDDPSAAARGRTKRAGWENAAVRVLATADAIPADMIAATKRLEADLRSEVQSALVSEPVSELSRAAGDMLGAESFVAPSQAHLDALTAILENLEEAPPSSRPYTLVPPPRS
jgi:phosphonate transport system substrate-binding protein